MLRAVSEYNQLQEEFEAAAEATIMLKEERRQHLAEVTNRVNSLVNQFLSQHGHVVGAGEAAVQLTSGDLISDATCCRQRSSAMGYLSHLTPIHRRQENLCCEVVRLITVFVTA